MDNTVDIWPTVCTCSDYIANLAQAYNELVATGIEPAVAMNTLGITRMCCRIRILSPTTYLLRQAQHGMIPPTIYDKKQNMATFSMEGSTFVKMGIADATEGVVAPPLTHVLNKGGYVNAAKLTGGALLNDINKRILGLDAGGADVGGGEFGEFGAIQKLEEEEGEEVETEPTVQKTPLHIKPFVPPGTPLPGTPTVPGVPAGTPTPGDNYPLELVGIVEPKLREGFDVNTMEDGAAVVDGYLRDDEGNIVMLEVGDGYRIPVLQIIYKGKRVGL